MRRLPIAVVAALMLSAAALPATAAAQDAAAELMRKAKAGEKDNGFCAGSGLERVEFGQVQARINRLLAQSDAPVRLTVAVFQQGGSDTICFHFVFAPPAQREGKKCRATESYGCRAGADCLAPKADFICEVRPGEWD